MLTVLVLLVAGLAVLFLGRKLFWLFVVVTGFGAGWVLAPALLPGQSEIIHLLAALAGGFVGAMLALVLQRNAVALAGCALGCYFIFWLLEITGSQFHAPPFSMQWWTLLIVGGGLGAIPVFVLYDFALIVLSSLAGVILIVEALRLPAFPVQSSAVIPVGLVLLVAGIVIQTILFKQR